MPPLHEEPNPIAETSRIEASLKDRGTVTSLEFSFVDPSARIEDTSTPEYPFCTWLSADISFELLTEETLGLSIVQTDTRTIFFKKGYLLQERHKRTTASVEVLRGTVTLINHAFTYSQIDPAVQQMRHRIPANASRHTYAF